ncbi:hypothetical protein [Sphingomonas sp. MM-1]|uniref:hypothetical protein n=1 Tax=Sphingomonas sp. MM-1 TaxID=745310 RepID=UPI0005A45E89|nr:hypothetical protein [Sphingomonas sp. MM-1]
MIWMAATLLATALGGAAQAREPLGLFGGWGAFRDVRPLRCYAIAEAVDAPLTGKWRPFASIAHWPGRQVRGQLHIRLRAVKQRGALVTLAVDGRRFTLVAGGADAWAPDAATDAAIVAAMRGGDSMRVETRGEDGKRMSDHYELRGAATAIDAAAIACAPGR